ncbi:DNA-binding protein D-ETS-3 [Zootermopsis nevadensis]|uniref:DNA-binding protein D-ETS-3 n=1 Tax=Zootermopsis nevadensis TaxID=136037 RepID=A0A067RGP3_ZOONE|nr:DNA-binding protein D-ETS-3 [Zootermopsis nevadensis]
MPAIKSEDCMSAGLSGTAGDWAAGCAYRFACNSSTFEQLKQSVEKAKAALQDRGSYLAASSAFSDLASSPFAPPPRNNAATQDLLQDTRRDDAMSSVSDKRTHTNVSRGEGKLRQWNQEDRKRRDVDFITKSHDNQRSQICRGTSEKIERVKERAYSLNWLDITDLLETQVTPQGVTRRRGGG